jgi:hypothetical protein
MDKGGKHKLCQYIIKKYVQGQINWPREIKIAQKLIKKFHSSDFWVNLVQLKSPPPSLAWFLKLEGKAFLLKEYEKFNIVFEKDKVELNKNKTGEDKKICQKPKTLL